MPAPPLRRIRPQDSVMSHLASRYSMIARASSRPSSQRLGSSGIAMPWTGVRKRTNRF